MTTKRCLVAMLAVSALFVAACGSDTDAGEADAAPAPPADESPAVDPPAVDPPAVDPPAVDPPAVDPPAVDPPVEDPPTEDVSALDRSGDVLVLDWQVLSSSPSFNPSAGTESDPFFQIHTNPGADGFFLSFEMFTVWGAAWQGQTGTFELTCEDAGSDTGICVYFDSDGPGPLGVVGPLAVSGSITVNALGPDGYDLVVSGLAFTDGTAFEDFSMVG